MSQDLSGDPLGQQPNFEAGAPVEPMDMNAPQPTAPAPAATPAPQGKKLVDMYTAMLFVAAIFLLVGSIALAWEKQRYGEMWGNSWKIPPSFKVSAVERPGDFDHQTYFHA